VSQAFREAERARREGHRVSLDQRRHLKKLALKAGIEMPDVFNARQATDAITRLEGLLRQPELEGFRAVSGG
jgi:hypothetical protein